MICDGEAVMVEKGVGPFLENGQKSVWNQMAKIIQDRVISAKNPVNIENQLIQSHAPPLKYSHELTTWQGFE